MTYLYDLTKWLVVVADDKDFTMFTAADCDEETAMAIAISTYGPGVTKIMDEGAVRQGLSMAQLDIVDNAYESGRHVAANMSTQATKPYGQKEYRIIRSFKRVAR